jgi:hypothetical protein
MCITTLMLPRLFLGIATIATMAGCQREREPTATGDRGGELIGGPMSTARTSTKALFPNADWLETNYAGLEFMFCANDLPAYGNSTIEVHGWAYRQHSAQWESILKIRLMGLGRVALSVDSKSGAFVVKGTANNKFLDQSVLMLDLRAQ